MKYSEMNRNYRGRHARKHNRGGAMLLMSLMLVCALAIGGLFAVKGATGGAAVAEATGTSVNIAGDGATMIDTSPAIYVAQKNANSVVGIITNTQSWD